MDTKQYQRKLQVVPFPSLLEEYAQQHLYQLPLPLFPSRWQSGGLEKVLTANFQCTAGRCDNLWVLYFEESRQRSRKGRTSRTKQVQHPQLRMSEVRYSQMMMHRQLNRAGVKVHMSASVRQLHRKMPVGELSLPCHSRWPLHTVAWRRQRPILQKNHPGPETDPMDYVLP